jgi:hypothetical protein
MTRFALVMLLVAALSLSGCGKPTPTPTPTPSPTLTPSPTPTADTNPQGPVAPPPTSSQPVTFEQLDSSQNQEPLLLYFLLDASKSVVGGGERDHCPEPQSGFLPAHRQFVMYLVNVLNSLSADSFPLEKLYIGIGRFGSRFDERYYTGDEIGRKYSEIDAFVAREKDEDNNTRYEEGLEKARSSIQRKSNHEGISNVHLILLTDGFRDGINKEAVEKQISAFSDGISLHVGLICPSPSYGDTGFWAEHNLKKETWKNGPSEWMSKIFDLLKGAGYLPDQSGWFSSLSQTRQVKVSPSPYALSAVLHYAEFEYEFEGKPFKYQSVHVNGVPVRLSSSYPYDIEPAENCSVSPLVLSASTDMDVGFWWIKHTPLGEPEITLDVPSQGKNGEPLLVTAHVTIPSLPIAKMISRRQCFSGLNLQQADKQPLPGSLSVLPCEDGGGGLCVEKGGQSLYRTWEWTPRYDAPQRVDLTASLGNASATQEISIRFLPRISISKAPNIVELPYILEIVFRSEEDPGGDPEIYLEKSLSTERWERLSFEVQKQYGDNYLCPTREKSSPFPNQEGYDYAKILRDFDIKKGVFFTYLQKSLAPNQNEYTVRAYGYIFSTCQTSAIVFQWRENETTAPLTLRCPWDPQNSKVLPCQPIP